MNKKNGVGKEWRNQKIPFEKFYYHIPLSPLELWHPIKEGEIGLCKARMKLFKIMFYSLFETKGKSGINPDLSHRICLRHHFYCKLLSFFIACSHCTEWSCHSFTRLIDFSWWKFQLNVTGIRRKTRENFALNFSHAFPPNVMYSFLTVLRCMKIHTELYSTFLYVKHTHALLIFCSFEILFSRYIKCTLGMRMNFLRMHLHNMNNCAQVWNLLYWFECAAKRLFSN